MPIKMSQLIPGALYYQDDRGQQIFLYLGKGTGINNKWSHRPKSGHIFLYVGRAYDTGMITEKPMTSFVMWAAKEMLDFRLGEEFSIVQRKEFQRRYAESFVLSQEDIDKLYAYGNLSKTVQKVTGIKTVTGDILTPNPKPNQPCLVCHQVNCMGKMGAGLALSIRKAFPSVYRVYKEKCDDGMAQLGDVQYCSVLGDANYVIVNVFGQYGYGRGQCQTNYEALGKAFAKIHQAFPNEVVRIPYKMGCGLGGGDWNTVLNIIKESFEGQPVEIWKLEN